MLKIISQQSLEELSLKASSLPRKRLNFNYHEDLADPINRMLNAFEPGTYLQPHKHQNPDKNEVFIVLKGKMIAVIFDDSGKPLQFILLDPVNGNHGIEIPAGTWHTVIALETGSVVYEIKDGPYVPMTDKNFASWAPKEGDSDCTDYINLLISQYSQQAL